MKRQYVGIDLHRRSSRPARPLHVRNTNAHLKMEREVAPVRRGAGSVRREATVRTPGSVGLSRLSAGRTQIEVTTTRLRLCPLAILPWTTSR